MCKVAPRMRCVSRNDFTAAGGGRLANVAPRMRCVSRNLTFERKN